MPIPLSATHPQAKAAGAAATHAELPTAGPFARLAADAAAAGSSGEQAATGAQQQAPAAAGAGDRAGPPGSSAEPSAIATHHLNFFYPGIDGRPAPGAPAVVQDMTIDLPQGARCLLVGPNGAGKTTLLKVLGGKHMVPKESVRVLGEPPFHATHLGTTGALSYVGGNWERDVAFAGYSVPLAGDIGAGQMLNSVPGVDPQRRERLIEALDIDVSWRMHQVSDGQRRRVQIAMGLLKPFQVLLLDEITVDLDVLGRADLLAFLEQECRERGATIVYATHIFDGLESWPTHVMYLAGGQLKVFERAQNILELREGRLLELVERWLRREKEERQARHEEEKAQVEGARGGEDVQAVTWNSGWAPGRLTASIKLSSNTVLRM